MKKLILLLFISIGLSLSGQNYYYAIHDTAGGTPPAPAAWLLLDSFPNAAFAYSLIQLDKDYTDSVIVVRRGSDNSSQSFDIINGIVDTTAIKTFVGVGDGFASWVYDWSGNGKHAVQTTGVNQPKIVGSGKIIKGDNGLPSLQFDGDDYFSCGSITWEDVSVFTTVSADFSTNVYRAVVSAFSSNGLLIRRVGTTAAYWNIGEVTGNCNYGSVNATTASPRPTNGQHTMELHIGEGSISFYIDGVSSTRATSPQSTSSLTKPLEIGRFNGGDYWLGKIQSIMIWPEDKSTNRTGIDAMLP